MTDTIVDSVFKKIVFEIASHSLAGTCFFSSVIMLDILKKKKIDVGIRFGFLHTPKVNLCNFHVWIEYKKRQYDISATATYLITEEELFAPKNFILEKDIRDGYERNDLDTNDEKLVAEELQKAVEKFKKEKVFDWSRAPMEQRIVAYKCYVSCGEKAPFKKPNPHHYNWLKDQFTRSKFLSVTSDLKDYLFTSSPFGAVMFHEILNTYNIKSTVTPCIKKINGNEFYNICLNIDGNLVDTNEFFRGEEYREFSLRTLTAKDRLGPHDMETQYAIAEYNKLSNKDYSSYWKNAPDILRKIRALAMKTHGASTLKKL